MDADRPAGYDPHEPEEPAGSRKSSLRWADAIPKDLNWGDSLEVAARIGPAAVAMALAKVIEGVGIPLLKRASVIAQLAGQLPGLIDKRRLWEAEKLIRGEVREMKDIGAGPIAEREKMRDATGQETDPTVSGRTPRRGRPRKRSLL